MQGKKGRDVKEGGRERNKNESKAKKESGKERKRSRKIKVKEEKKEEWCKGRRKGYEHEDKEDNM